MPDIKTNLPVVTSPTAAIVLNQPPIPGLKKEPQRVLAGSNRTPNPALCLSPRTSGGPSHQSDDRVVLGSLRDLCLVRNGHRIKQHLGNAGPLGLRRSHLPTRTRHRSPGRTASRRWSVERVCGAAHAGCDAVAIRVAGLYRFIVRCVRTTRTRHVGLRPGSHHGTR